MNEKQLNGSVKCEKRKGLKANTQSAAASQTDRKDGKRRSFLPVIITGN